MAAGSLVAQGARIRPGWLAMGIPAREVRELTPEEKAGLGKLAEKYCGIALEFKQAIRQGARA